MVVWSEAILRRALPNSMGRYEFTPQPESLFAFIRRSQIPFVIGGPYVLDSEGRKLGNAAIVFDKEANFRGYYAKSHLVPFAEVIPGVEVAWVRRLMDRMLGFSNGWTPGSRLALFDFEGRPAASADGPQIHDLTASVAEETLQGMTEKIRTAIPICFEDAFPDVCGPFRQAGAELFLNITDDSWSKTKSAEWQHFAVAAFRAVEYRTTLARSTNAGFTGVVDDKGRVISSIPLFEDGYLCAKIPIFARRSTVYSAFGNWFAHLALALVALLAVCAAARLKSPSLADCIRRQLELIEL